MKVATAASEGGTRATFERKNARPVPRPVVRPPLPRGLDDVALADINDIKALVRVGNSWIHAAVADGSFPAPVIRGKRFTRWRLADVKAYLAARVQEAA